MVGKQPTLLVATRDSALSRPLLFLGQCTETQWCCLLPRQRGALCCC